MIDVPKRTMEKRKAVVDLDSTVRGEAAENFDRKDFQPTEIDAIRLALLPIEQAAAKERMTLGKLSLGSHAGKTLDKIGSFAGVSGRTVEKIAVVMEAAERHPKRFGKLLADMERTGRVNGPYKRLKVARRRHGSSSSGGRQLAEIRRRGSATKP